MTVALSVTVRYSRGMTNGRFEMRRTGTGWLWGLRDPEGVLLASSPPDGLLGRREALVACQMVKDAATWDAPVEMVDE